MVHKNHTGISFEAAPIMRGSCSGSMIIVPRWHGCSTWCFLVLFFHVWAWGGNASSHPFLRRTNSSLGGAVVDFHNNSVQEPPLSSSYSPLFGRNWAIAFANEDIGCNSGRGSFMWRGQGFGSNVNSESNTYTFCTKNERQNCLEQGLDVEDCQTPSAGIDHRMSIISHRGNYTATELCRACYITVRTCTSRNEHNGLQQCSSSLFT